VNETQRLSPFLMHAARSSVLAIAVMAVLSPSIAAANDDGNIFFVAPSGSDGNSCTASAPCRTIGHAVSMAGAGDTVVVRRGTYREDVAVPVGLALHGVGNPTIDAAGLDNGIVVTGAGADVAGFNVVHATFEGILVENTHDVTIRNNVVKANDQGIFLPPDQQTGECVAAGQIPGDCGEGIHLWAVTFSKVEHNWVGNNAGGILLTDETGPTAFNVIAQNTVVDNQADCGITIAGHNPTAAPGGVPNPAAGGIYSNIVAQNHADRNGVSGEGAGILLAGGPPGTAVYNNQIVDNEASGNGLAGVTLHSHAPGQDLTGNVIIGNRLGNDNLDGDFDFSPATDPQTTGIFIASAVPLTGTVVQGNVIRQVYYGIWTLNVPPIADGTNHFAKDVTVPIFQQ
jgi:nitrous oxidase accessory protein NosD